MEIIYYNEPINSKFFIEAGHTLYELNTKEEQKQKYFELTKTGYRNKKNSYAEEINEHIYAIRNLVRLSCKSDITDEDYYENIINNLGDVIDDIEDLIVTLQ